MSLKISSAESATRQQRSSNSSLSLSYAHMVVKEIEFDPVEGINDDGVDFNGPFDIDLLAGSSVPSIPLASLTIGKYEEAGIELYDEENKSPSITVKGTYINPANALDTISFVFKALENFEFEADAENSTSSYLFEVVSESDTVSLSMIVDLNQWFQNVVFSDGIKDVTTNEVIVTSSSNVGLFNQIKANIEKEVLIIKQN